MNSIIQLKPKASILLTSVSALMLLFASTRDSKAAYPDLILSDNPVAYYRLEELPGAFTAVDSSTNGFDADYVQDSSGIYPELGLPGIDTNSVLFNGGDDFGSVDIPYNILLSPTNGDGITGAPFSAECWARPTSDSLSDYTSPLAMSGAYTTDFPNGSGWNFYQTQGPGSSWSLFIRGGAVYTYGGPAITLLKWYHLAVTWDGTNAAFYVNGVAQGSSAINYKAVDALTTYDGAIGSGPETGHGAFAGGVDEVAFYDYALTGDQIAAHYTLGTNSFAALPTGPSILADVSPATNYSGTTASFTLLANGTDPLDYQWFRGSTPISGATNNSYSFTTQYPADDGATFYVVVTNQYGSATSSVVSLTVLTDVVIAGTPFSITRNVGSHAAFRVAARGAKPISYVWSVSTNGGSTFATIPSQTGDTLWLTNVQLTMDGYQYAVLVSNPFTNFDSSTAPATLNVQPRAVNVPITGYAKVIMADNPVAYWRLDETNSIVATDAAGSFDGAYDSSLGNITYGIAPGVPHETNSAVDLSDTNEVAIGQGGVVRIPYALELNPFGPWTAEAWVRPDSNDNFGNFRTVLSSMYNPNSSQTVFGWIIYQHPNGGAGAWTLNIFNGTGGPGFFGSDFGHIPLITNLWYHLVLTDDGTTIGLYVNGVLGSAQTSVSGSGYVPQGVNGDPTLGGADEVLGQRSDGAFFGFSGGMDEVAYYNYALTAQQVQAHYLNGTKLSFIHNASGLVLSWPSGTLQSAPSLSGPWTPVAGATSPYTVSLSGPSAFYRLQTQ